MRRLFLLLLCFVLLCGGSCAEADADPLDAVFEQITFISQTDARYREKTYKFNNATFETKGCGPASITNMLLALFRVQDWDTTDALLLEVERVLCNGKDPKTRNIALEPASRFGTVTQEEAPVLASLREELGGDWLHLSGKFTAEDALTVLEPYMEQDAAVTLTAFTDRSNQMTETAKLLCALYDAGYDEAEVYLTLVSGGTARTGGPFRYTDGHYICLLFPAGRWMQGGGYYLIDSYPRALKDETVGVEPYDHRYPFVVNYNCTNFRATWQWERLRTTCLRFDWTEEKSAEMENFTTGEERQKASIAQMKMLNLYGDALLLVRLPGAEITTIEGVSYDAGEASGAAE